MATKTNLTGHCALHGAFFKDAPDSPCPSCEDAPEAQEVTTPHPFKKGEQYRVTKPGASLSGWKPVAPYCQDGWGRPLEVGEILTCAGTSMSQGDGVPLVKWLDKDGEWVANDCEFHPSVGGMWALRPDSSYLELVS